MVPHANKTNKQTNKRKQKQRNYCRKHYNTIQEVLTLTSPPLIRKPASRTRVSNGGHKVSDRHRPKKATSSRRIELKFGMVTKNQKLRWKM